MMQGRFQPPARQIVYYGRPLAEALDQALKDLWSSQAVVVTNTSLAQPGRLLEKVTAPLGEIVTNVVTGVRENSPRADVIRIAGSLRGRGTESLIAVGGGSVIEAAKAARICLTNNVADVEDMDRLKRVTTAASPRPYLIAIPTTLSGPEFTPFAGILDERTGVKDAFFHTDLAPDVVILDPEATRDTPARLWAATGVRAVDHAVETWCSTNASPYGDAGALAALPLLARGLVASVADPADMAARNDCQVGAWMAIQGGTVGVVHGASHGIGHALSGVTGMNHGITSCIMLPHVLRWNAAVNADRQAVLAGVLGQQGRPLADVIHDLIGKLGVPQRLRDDGVREDQLGAIADLALTNFRVKANPRPFDRDAMLAVLRAAW